MNTKVSMNQPAECTRHGPFVALYVDALGYHLQCPQCGIEEDAERERTRDKRSLEERVEAYLHEARVPKRYATAELDDTVPQLVRGWVEEVIEESSERPLLILSHFGSGSTRMVCAATRHIARSEMGAVYTTGADYGRQVRDTWSRHTDCSESGVLLWYSMLPCLVLDEFGAGRGIDDHLVQDLLEARYETGTIRNTILVTTLPLDRLAEAAGERLAKRLRKDALVCRMPAGTSCGAELKPA